MGEVRWMGSLRDGVVHAWWRLKDIESRGPPRTVNIKNLHLEVRSGSY